MDTGTNQTIEAQPIRTPSAVGRDETAGRGPGAPGEPAATMRRRGLPMWAVGALAALAYWVVGALPWIVRGLEPPVPESWLRSSTGGAPWVALPLVPGLVDLLVVVAACGGIAAQLLAFAGRKSEDDYRAGAALAATLGGVVGAAATIGQSMLALRDGLEQTSDASLLVAGVGAAAALATAAGLVVGLGIVVGSAWVRVLAIAVAAGLLPTWAGGVASSVLGTGSGTALTVGQAAQWVAAGIVGLTLGIYGLRPARRVVTWLLVLVVVWTVPAALTAASYLRSLLRPTALQPGAVQDLLDAVLQVFRLALRPENHQLQTILMTIGFGLAGATWPRRRTPPERDGTAGQEPPQRHTPAPPAAGAR